MSGRTLPRATQILTWPSGQGLTQSRKPESRAYAAAASQRNSASQRIFCKPPPPIPHYGCGVSVFVLFRAFSCAVSVRGRHLKRSRRSNGVYLVSNDLEGTRPRHGSMSHRMFSTVTGFASNLNWEMMFVLQLNVLFLCWRMTCEHCVAEGTDLIVTAMPGETN